MLHIGNHLSSSGGFMAMGKEALELKADTFAFFTRNPRGGRAKNIDDEDAAAFRKFAEKHGFQKLVAHAPYTLNPCSNKKQVREFTYNTMADDLRRMEKIPHNYYNFHPGNHLKQGEEIGIELIAGCLNDVMQEDQRTTVLLETMSGKGTEIGKTFEEIKAIIDKVKLHDKIGVCLDTCHVWDSGYDIVNHLDDVIAKFDEIIGLEKLKAVHLNDSKNECGSHKDRHEKIGKGKIGLEAVIRIINHPALRNLPFILETPNDHGGYAEEIALLRGSFKE